MAGDTARFFHKRDVALLQGSGMLRAIAARRLAAGFGCGLEPVPRIRSCLRTAFISRSTIGALPSLLKSSAVRCARP